MKKKKEKVSLFNKKKRGGGGGTFLTHPAYPTKPPVNTSAGSPRTHFGSTGLQVDAIASAAPRGSSRGGESEEEEAL